MFFFFWKSLNQLENDFCFFFVCLTRMCVSFLSFGIPIWLWNKFKGTNTAITTTINRNCYLLMPYISKEASLTHTYTCNTWFMECLKNLTHLHTAVKQRYEMTLRNVTRHEKQNFWETISSKNMEISWGNLNIQYKDTIFFFSKMYAFLNWYTRKAEIFPQQTLFTFHQKVKPIL